MAEQHSPPPVSLSQSTATSASTTSDDGQAHAKKKELHNLLEATMLCGSVDAVTGEIHGASNAVVLVCSCV